MTTERFTALYEAVWTMLLTNTTISAMVKPGNRVKLSGTDPDPEKWQEMDADLPAMIIMPSGSEFDLWKSVDLHMATQKFSITLDTGDKRLNRYWFPFKDALVDALLAAGPNLGLPYVFSAKLKACEEMINDDKGNITGWKGWVELLVVMSMSRADDVPDPIP